MRIRGGVAAVLLGLGAIPAGAQYHAECWYRLKSPYRMTGTQPSTTQIFATMKALCKTYGVPVEVVAAICYNESNWTQFASDGYAIHNRTSCTNLYRNSASQPNPPDVGLMELAGGTAKSYDVQRLLTDYAYNLESGIKVLIGKWDTYYKYVGPSYYPGRTFDHDKMVVENWYYPLKAYNGWANLTDFSYVERIYGFMGTPPSRTSSFVWPTRPTRPAEAIPGYTLPPAKGKYITWFKAYAPGNKFVDGNGASHTASTHRGTFGETTPTGSSIAIGPYAYKSTSSTLNVRSGPGTSNAILGTLSSGQTYCVNAKNTAGDWYRISFKGGYGWCYAPYMARVTGVTGVKINTTDMNVRSGPSTTYAIVGKASPPQIYIRIGSATGWHKINYAGATTGWVYASLTSTLAF